MNRLFTLGLLVLTSICAAQKYDFKPKWKVNDIKSIKTTQVEKSYEDSRLVSDSTIYKQAQIKVISVDKSVYTVEIYLENLAFQKACSYYYNPEENLKDYKDVKFLCSIDKDSVLLKLLNWAEVQKTMKYSMDIMLSDISVRAPDMVSYIDLAFMSVEETFSSKENVELYLQHNIGYLFIPFNKDFKPGETIKESGLQKSSIVTFQDIPTTTLLTMESVNKRLKSCVIHQEVKPDFTEFLKMMNGMIQSMPDSVKTDDGEAQSDMDLEVRDNVVINYNYKTTWVTKVLGALVFSGTDPGKGIKTRKEVITTTIVE